MAEKTASLAGRAYERIRQNILNLTYPPGMPLTEAMLTEELNMSRSPVRSAIQRLEAEGLIISDYHKSMTVKELTDQDISEIYQFRELMETAALKLIFSSGRNEEYSYRIEEKVVRMCALEQDLYEWQQTDNAMHMEIISIFGNSRINKIYENNLSELLRIGQYSVKNGMNISKTNESLRKMVRYMREGSYEKSCRVLREGHLITGRDSALKERG